MPHEYFVLCHIIQHYCTVFYIWESCHTSLENQALRYCTSYLSPPICFFTRVQMRRKKTDEWWWYKAASHIQPVNIHKYRLVLQCLPSRGSCVWHQILTANIESPDWGMHLIMLLWIQITLHRQKFLSDEVWSGHMKEEEKKRQENKLISCMKCLSSPSTTTCVQDKPRQEAD